MKTVGDFRYEKVLGMGAEGMVYEGESTLTFEKVAVKEISLKRAHSEELIEAVRAEYSLLSTIRSRYLVQIKGTFKTVNNLYIVYKLYAKDLHARLNSDIPLTEPLVQKWTNQILKGLVDLHYFNIVHRDLKPQNILFTSSLDDAQAVITDFGVAAKLGESELVDYRGTIKYMAPEVRESQPYNTKADVYSLGKLVQDMLNRVGSPSTHAQEFVQACLEPDQSLRPSSYELSKLPFIQQELQRLLHEQVIEIPERTSAPLYF